MQVVHIPKTPVTRKTLLAAVRAAVKAAGGRPITRRKFLATSGMKPCDLFRHYARWQEVLRAAGFRFEPPNKKIDQARLLADWARVAGKFRHLPSRRDYQIHGKYDPSVLARRFGSWTQVCHAFRAFAAKKPQWAGVLALLPPPRKAHPKPSFAARARPGPSRPACKAAPRLGDRPIYGEPLDFGPLRRAPVNESGVNFLFALLAERLGFQIEALQTAFPDCEAKRRIGPSAWQTVRIEFEFESRNFRDHGHNAKGCDLIVCWVDNWPDSPLEVIALKDEIERYAPCQTGNPSLVPA